MAEPAAPVVDPDAPYGLKADGTPRKRPVPTWAIDAKRAQSKAKRPREARQPRRPSAAATDADDMLARITREMDDRLAELEPLHAEYERLVLAREALPR